MKSKASMSLRALRQAIGLMPSAGRLSTVQDVPLNPPPIKASIVAVTTSAPSPPPTIVVQEVTPTIAEVTMSATQSDSARAPSSTSAPTVLPISSSAQVVFPFVVLAVVASSY